MINPLSIIKWQKGSVHSESEEKRLSITNSVDNLEVKGTRYYISQNGNDLADGKSPETAWRTLEKLTASRELLKEGDAVLFERGSVFRQENLVHPELWRNNCILAVSGVNYGAYGDGPKPAFFGSSFNYAKRPWEKVSENIWQTEFALQDAGIIVFNQGECIGIKKYSFEDLQYGNDFYHDIDKGILYLYSENGSPSECYNDIEIGCNRPVFLFCGHAGNVTIENLDIRYVGGHAISGYEFNHDIVIRNCEISWVGGSWQQQNVVRYGNAVQFWDSCWDILIEDCWVYQVYDAGLTFQGGKGAQYKNITFRNNLIQYCNYCIEYFIQGTKNEEGKYKTTGLLENINFSGNIMQFAGYGVCEQRPDKMDSCQICGWATDVGNDVKQFSITDNIFDLSACHFIYWIWDEEGITKVSGNEFYMKKAFSDSAMKYGIAGQVSAVNQNELVKAVDGFDKTPKCVKWLDE